MYRLEHTAMPENADYLRLIKRARHCDPDSVSRLAQEARARVFVYIYRMTLDHHLAQDLAQDTMLEMLQSLKRLRIESVDSFWTWLFRTALGKVQHHFRYQGNRRIEKRTRFYGDSLLEQVPEDRRSSLDKLLRKELSQAVLKSMGQIKLQYRNILAMRCFEQLSYAQIAKITGGTELQSRLLLFRAKRSLKKQLARNGFKKENLLTALGLFGVITAYSTRSASAATVVSSAATKVGLTAAAIGTATTTLGITSIVTVVILTTVTIGTVKSLRNESGISRSPDTSSLNINRIDLEAFESPNSMIGMYDPDGNGWEAAYYRQGGPVIPFSPEKLLVGARPQKQPDINLIVILPKDHWLELGFPGEIVDGPGIDVCWDGRTNGEMPALFISDGAGQEVQITSAPSYLGLENGYGLIGFDISALSIPFKPRALRFVGTHNKGPWGGVELWGVWARTSR